jgi:4'-phosphopantetheinyl transferase
MNQNQSRTWAWELGCDNVLRASFALLDNVEQGNPLNLGEALAHIWVWDLTGFTSPELDVLDPSEKKRAAQFHFERDRQNFLRSHVTVRNQLSHYLQQAPDSIRYAHNKHGKPKLAVSNEETGVHLQFNYSHSGSWLALGITAEGEIGVDIEQLAKARVPEWRKIAARFFSPPEAEALQPLSDDEGYPAFMRLWTAKESILKSQGSGLGSWRGLPAIDRLPGPEPLVAEGELEGVNWWMVTVQVEDEAALAVSLCRGK